jgi:hypothetical protein
MVEKGMERRGERRSQYEWGRNKTCTWKKEMKLKNRKKMETEINVLMPLH